MAHREYDAEADATYFVVSEGTFDHTVHVTDLIMVNVDEHGNVLGVEFAFNDEDASQGELDMLFGAYPQLRKELPMGYRRRRPIDMNELAGVVVSESIDDGESSFEGSVIPWALSVLDGQGLRINDSIMFVGVNRIIDDAELLVS
jgi:uncharacterized protein YuzE